MTTDERQVIKRACCFVETKDLEECLADYVDGLDDLIARYSAPAKLSNEGLALHRGLALARDLFFRELRQRKGM